MIKVDKIASSFETINFLTKILIASALFYFASRTFLDPDLWWHLKCGIEIYKSHSIQQIDPYSFLTFDWRWINEEWLFQLIIAAFYLNLHWWGLVLFKTSVALAILWITNRVLFSFSLDIFGQGIMLLGTAILLSPATNVIRPHIVTCLFLTVVFVVIRNFPKHPRQLFLLPLIFLPWVNVHGGFIVGMVTLVTFAILYSFLNRGLEKNKEKLFLWSTTIICCLLSLANPYGLALPMRVLVLCGYPHPDIGEWQPILITSGFGILWFITIVTVVLSLVFSKESKNLSRILLWSPFAIAPLISVRHLPFLGIASVILVGEHLAYIWKLRQKSSTAKNSWGFSEILFSIIAVLTSVALILAGYQFFNQPRVVPNQDIPYSALGLIKRAHIKGDLLLDFDWGGYTLWHLSPDIKVSFDTRREWAYSPAASVANMQFTSGEGSWDHILNKFPVVAVLTAKNMPGWNLMKLKPNWELIYEDSAAALFLPANSQQLLEAKHVLEQIPKGEQENTLALPLF